MQFLSPIIDWLAKQRISIVLALTVSVTALVIFAVAAILAFGGLGDNGQDLRLVENGRKQGLNSPRHGRGHFCNRLKACLITWSAVFAQAM